MRVIPPLTITPAMLTSSTVSEPSAGETAWSAATTYMVLGEQVISTTTHKIYQCINVTLNMNRDPALAVNSTYWSEVGPTNKWSAFDLLRSTRTTATTSMSMVLTPGTAVNSIALAGLVNVATATVSVTISGVVTTITKNMSDRKTTGWYDYFFGVFTTKNSLLIFKLPTDPTAVITVTLTGFGVIGCGSLILGNYIYLGSTQNNANVGALNFSTVTRDLFGNATLIPKRNVPKTTQTVFIKKDQVNNVIDAREILNGLPAMWSGLDDLEGQDYFEALVILGYFTSFTMGFENDLGTFATIELEEV